MFYEIEGKKNGMHNKTIVIVGAGPGLGLAIAREFGKKGFQEALIARHMDALNQLVVDLKSNHIEAKAYVGDVSDEQSLIQAFTAIKADFGSIDVLEYSPLTRISIPASQVTTDAARTAFQSYFLGAVASVQQVLPDMLQRGDGTILLTGGRAAILPMWQLGSVSPMAAALRNYAYILNAELADKHVYVATASICSKITPDVAAEIAALYWNMYEKRDRPEDIVGEEKAGS